VCSSDLPGQAGTFDHLPNIQAGDVTLLNTKAKGLPLFRTIFYLPVIVPAVAGAGVFVTIDRRRGARSGTHALYLMDHTGQLMGEPIRLLLNRASSPVSLELLDGAILVGTKDSVIALPAVENLE